MKQQLTAEIVYKRMEKAIESIYQVTQAMPWEDKAYYANWLAQSFFYVQWTTRQLALASAKTKPQDEDTLHWRFIEEAKEEKKHEMIAKKDLEAMGHKVSEFDELPHTAFFYQTLTYMIENDHPIAILGYSLTLEGYAATKLSDVYQRVLAAHGEKATTFLKLHAEVDVEHFANALPHLQACPQGLLPVVYRGVELCEAVYKGILQDIKNKEGL